MAWVLPQHENEGQDKRVESVWFPCLDEGSTPSISTKTDGLISSKVGSFWLTWTEMEDENKRFWKKDEMLWFVLRIKWVPVERLEELLKDEGVETFIPRRYMLKTDSKGRKHRVLRNVLPELVFVHNTYEFLQPFTKKMQVKCGLSVFFCKQRAGDHNRVMVVPNREMTPFIKAVTEMEERITYLQPDELELKKGDTVRVHGGPLDGQIGEVTRLKGKRKKQLVLRLMDFTAISVTTVEPEYVELVNPEEI